MKVAVLGASGMLGSMLVKYLSKYFDLVATVRENRSCYDSNIEWRLLNAENPTLVSNILSGCDWAINAIGMINKYVNDKSLVEAVKVNTIFPRLLADSAESVGCQVIQIASDCVFSGSCGNYCENAVHDPTDLYGKTKSLGEIESSNMHHLRCSIVGPELKNHVSLLDWFLSQPRGTTINGFTNHIWNGITTLHFAKICRGIIENDVKLPHLQHIVPANVVSKSILLEYFATEFGREYICIKRTLAPQEIDRVIGTCNPKLNYQLWKLAGYPEPPTIEQMVKELAEYSRN